MSVQIVPVIDLMGGIVVHARQGQRDNYKEIESMICSSSEPVQFIKDLLAFQPFTSLYLADLDAIETGVLHLHLYKKLLEHFPAVQFWLDAGVKSRHQWQQLKKLTGLTVILGSETLEDLSLLKEAEMLSLDFKQGQLLGNPALLDDTSLWPRQIIVLSLDAVGSSHGPQLTVLEQVQGIACQKHKWIMGGGVRAEADLVTLNEKNVQGILLASALHNGRISKQLVLKYQ